MELREKNLNRRFRRRTKIQWKEKRRQIGYTTAKDGPVYAVTAAFERS